MPAPKETYDLVERFRRSIEAYTSGQYNETQLRREFLDPFFAALGWDVENKQGYAEAYKDVVHEDSIKIGTAIKAPDYSFRVGGNNAGSAQRLAASKTEQDRTPIQRQIEATDSQIDALVYEL